MLSHEEIRHFRHCGFLKLSDRVPEVICNQLKDAIWYDIRHEIQPIAKDVEGRVNRISQVLDRDPVFLQTVAGTIVTEPLGTLIGQNIELVKNRHNHATLNRATTRSDRFHRDVTQWTRGIVTVIFYLEEATVERGCTEVVPGSHLLPGLEPRQPPDEIPWVQEARILEQSVPVPMPEGGMLAIDSLLFHRIGTNRTGETRMSMTMGYRSIDELSDGEDPGTILIQGKRWYGGNDKQALDARRSKGKSQA